MRTTDEPGVWYDEESDEYILDDGKSCDCFVLPANARIDRTPSANEVWNLGDKVLCRDLSHA